MNPFISKNIITELGLDKLEAKQQEELILRIGTILYQAVLLRTFNMLSEEEKNSLDDQLGQDGNNPDTVIEFLQKRLPNFDQIVEEEIARFKKESIDIIRAASQK